jgi:DNA-binding CsgD family transcriptional regulator
VKAHQVRRATHPLAVRLKTAATGLSQNAAAPAPLEIVLFGRRYRLVIEHDDEDGCAAAPAAAATPAPETVAPHAPAAELLTARELEVAVLVALGRVSREIAAELGISEWTVSTHIRRIFHKLDVDSRAAMVARCFGAQTRSGDPGTGSGDHTK